MKAKKKKSLGLGMKDLLKITFEDDLSPYKSKIEEKKKEISKLEIKLKKIKKDIEKSQRQKDNIKQPDFSEDIIYKDGVKLLKDEQLIEALEKFSAILAYNPNHIKALNNSGVIFFELELVDYARERFNKVLVLEPKNPTARDNLAIIIQMSGDADE